MKSQAALVAPSFALVVSNHAVPMKIDVIQRPRGPISVAERASRMEQGLCFYCGLEGHVRENCPKGRNNHRIVALGVEVQQDFD